jgi:hypothetical protein
VTMEVCKTWEVLDGAAGMRPDVHQLQGQPTQMLGARQKLPD